MLLRHKKMWTDGPEDWSDSEQEDMLRGVCFGKGSSSKNTAPAQPTSQTVSQTNLPDYAEPFVTGLMERAETASLNPYEAYSGPRLAGFDANTTAGFDAITQRAQSDTPAAFTNAESRGWSRPFRTASAVRGCCFFYRCGRGRAVYEPIRI